MTDDELEKLFGVAKLSKPYAYTDVSTSSIIPRPRESCCCLLSSPPTDELLVWVGLAPVEEGNGKVGLRTEESPYQQLPPYFNPSMDVFFVQYNYH